LATVAGVKEARERGPARIPATAPYSFTSNTEHSTLQLIP